MLKRLKITNFQRLQELDAVLGRITVIVGPTDRGKSSFRRALRWLVFSRPVGSNFIRWGKKQAKVELWFGKHHVTRSKGEGGNCYFLDGKKYAHGNKVPPAISKLLKIGPDNFQLQHDQAFWFSRTPGQVAQELNRIVDLAGMDRAMKAAADQVRECKSKLDVVKERVDEAKQDKAATLWVVRMKRDLERIESLDRGVKSRASVLRQAAFIVQDLSEAVQAVETASLGQRRALSIVHKARGLSKASDAFNGRDDVQRRASRIMSEIQTLEESICQQNEQQKRKRKALEKKLNGRCPVCGGLLTG